MNKKTWLLAGILIVCCLPGHTQDASSTALQSAVQLPGNLLQRLSGRAAQLQENAVRQTEKYCRMLARREKVLKKKLARTDSTVANNIFGNTDSIYKAYAGSMRQPADNNIFSNVYSHRLDSLKTAMQFLDKHGLIGRSVQEQQQVKELLAKYSDLQGVFNNTEALKKVLIERQQLLQQQLQRFGMPGIQSLQKQLYYYQAQMEQYRQAWEDPSVMEQQLTKMLCKIPEFRKFFDQFSDLGAVFSLPGNTGASAANTNLQTRTSLNSFIQSGNSGNLNVQTQLQNNLPAPVAQTNNIRSLLPALPTSGSSTEEMPNFKPNHQKVRSFLKRIELGTSLQTTKANYYFPATSDVALSAGYRLNDKSVIGLGAGGKVGWGNGWNQVRVTGQGMSLRTFLDYKVKGTWWLSGGWEYHYQQPVVDAVQLHSTNNWKQSGLLGLTKVVPIKMKTFQKYRIQFFYDFLYRNTPPVTEPFKFRIGYSF